MLPNNALLQMTRDVPPLSGFSGTPRLRTVAREGPVTQPAG